MFRLKSKLRTLIRKTTMAKVFMASKQSAYGAFTTISSSNAPLGVGERKHANVPSDAFPVSDLMNRGEIRIRANASEDATGTLYIYGSRDNDDCCLIGSAAITVGQQEATDGRFYVDTIVLTDRWITEVTPVDCNGNNGMSRLVLDLWGYTKLFARIQYSAGPTDWVLDIAGV